MSLPGDRPRPDRSRFLTKAGIPQRKETLDRRPTAHKAEELLLSPAIVILVILLVLILFIGVCSELWAGGKQFVVDYWQGVWDTALSFFQICAIVVAGWWTWRVFVQRRLALPQTNTTLQISHRALPENKVYLSVTFALTNTGNVIIKPKLAEVHVRQVLPLVPHLRPLLTTPVEDQAAELLVEGMEIAWPEIGYRKFEWKGTTPTVEPGESEVFQFDFILDAAVQTIRIHSYISTLPGAEKGWRQTTLYDLARTESHQSADGT